MEMQHADGTDFVSTSHDFVEDVMNVLQTLSSPNTVCCATQTRRRGRTCLKDRIGKEQYSWCTLVGRARRASQVMQLANLAFWCMCGLFSGVTASLELKIQVPHREVRVWSATQRGQGVECHTERSDQHYFMAVDMGSNHNHGRETACAFHC